jgi:release factor glutamine methyltransferase
METPVKSNASPELPVTVKALLHGNELPRLEQTILLGHALGMARAALLAHPERLLARKDVLRFERLVARRRAGEPIAYLVGKREFYDLELQVGPDVLIPRPETELLVDAALGCVPPARRSRVLDLGTGSGAIALAIARHRPAAEVTAVDVSAAALAVAGANARALGIANVRFIESDWYAALPVGERFDLIASNPPYVAAGDPHLEAGDLRFEPKIALASGNDGLSALRIVIGGARSRLVPGGCLLVEHGYDQGERCRTLLEEAGFADISTLRDLAGNDRVGCGRFLAVGPE